MLELMGGSQPLLQTINYHTHTRLALERHDLAIHSLLDLGCAPDVAYEVL